MGENDLYLILGALIGRARPKSVKYQFTNFGWLTPRDFEEGAKIILKLLFQFEKTFLQKNKGTIEDRKTARMSYI